MKGQVGLLVFVVMAAAFAVLPQLVFAHLLENGKGPVDAFNFDEATASHLNDDCAYKYECQPTYLKDEYFFGCRYDVSSAECQCSKGGLSKCDAGRSSLASAKPSFIKGFPVALVGGVFGKFGKLPFFAKAIVAIAVLVAAVVLFMRARDNAANNFRRARALHTKASEMHEKGDEDDAKLLFEKSNYHREKAYGQMKGG